MMVGTAGLTRRELSWLLAEEARSAARALRNGLAGDAGNRQRDPSIPLPSDPCEALADVVATLSQMPESPRHPPARGRVDLAAILCEISPLSRVRVAPGAGTEVFGDADELRRILHVMVHQSHSVNVGNRPPIGVRREDEWVIIEVELGPDIPAAVSMDQRWLSRTAIRHGGRLELHGNTQTLWLRADGAPEREELASLREELQQAKQLGEAYARALGESFAAADEQGEKKGGGFRSVVGLSAAVTPSLRALLQELQTVLRDARAAIDHNPDLATRATAAMAHGRELAGELARVADCSADDPPQVLDVGSLLRDAVTNAGNRAARHDVRLRLKAPEKLIVTSKKRALALALRAMIDHAIAATPGKASIEIELESAADGFVLRVGDGGPPVAEADRDALLGGDLDPTAVGRPQGPALLFAILAAETLGATLTLDESQARQHRTVLNHN